MSKKRRELELGIDSNISRRDFLNGVAITIGATMLPSADLLAQASGPDSSAQEYFLSRGITQQNPEYYPPALTGMRGSHPGSFESAHALRDGNPLEQAIDTKEHYDLIVVGGGISGLAAAYFYKKSTGPKARILILDNHDDFGGHAKRNEFRAGNRLLLGYGGTQSIEAPGRYSKESIGLLKELGIDVQRFYKYYDQKLYASMHLKSGTFFDKETFGEDKLLQGPGEGYDVNTFVPVPAVAQMPIAEQARKDLIRLNQESIDYLPDLSPEQKRAKLATTSYKDYLLQNAKVIPMSQSSIKPCLTISSASASMPCLQRPAAEWVIPGSKEWRSPLYAIARKPKEEPERKNRTSSTSQMETPQSRACLYAPSCPVRPPAARWRTLLRQK